MTAADPIQIQVHYLAQLKQAAGRAEESVHLAEPLALSALAARLVAERAALRTYLDLVAGGNAIAFVNDCQRPWNDPTPLAHGDRVTFLAPMAGG